MIAALAARPMGAPMKMSKKFCNCRDVTYADIMKAIRGGATTADEVSRVTGAGTGCGRCREALDYVVRDFLEEFRAESEGTLGI
ncbi:MAG: (2Fe-2S)-binding protein [Coriobacteriaceae bacterium]|nr:MAG: (2Fe-2S)-binding protein [Coriobacteriaceae bacterium]